MKIYAINLIVDTKYTDIYDKVSLNKFPIIVRCEGEEELKDMLVSGSNIDYVKSLIKSSRVFDTSFWYIREVCASGVCQDIIWKLSDLINIEYL